METTKRSERVEVLKDAKCILEKTLLATITKFEEDYPEVTLKLELKNSYNKDKPWDISSYLIIE